MKSCLSLPVGVKNAQNLSHIEEFCEAVLSGEFTLSPPHCLYSFHNYPLELYHFIRSEIADSFFANYIIPFHRRDTARGTFSIEIYLA